MQLNIRAEGIELTPAIRSYVEEKFAMLEKYSSSMLNVEVAIAMDTHHHHKGEIYSCSATIQLPKEVLRVEKHEESLYKAIDKVKDHVREILVETKERQRDGHRKNDEGM